MVLYFSVQLYNLQTSYIIIDNCYGAVDFLCQNLLWLLASFFNLPWSTTIQLDHFKRFFLWFSSHQLATLPLPCYPDTLDTSTTALQSIFVESFHIKHQPRHFCQSTTSWLQQILIEPIQQIICHIKQQIIKNHLSLIYHVH